MDTISDVSALLETTRTAEEDFRLKRAQSLVGTSAGRPDGDYYPTPPEATEALLDRETFDGLIWEPACGDGAICRVLEARGHEVLATDLHYRGHGEGDHDFLTSPYTADNIITNPPFKLGEKFVSKALSCTTRKVAIFHKLQFLEGVRRKKMFLSLPFKCVYVFSKRVSLTRNGKKMKNSGMIAFAWYVFEHGYTGEAPVRFI